MAEQPYEAALQPTRRRCIADIKPARRLTQAAEAHRLMVAARAQRCWRAHAAGLNIPSSPSFDKGANDDEAGPSMPPPPVMF